MRIRPAHVAITLTLGFLLTTNPVVSQAAALLTGQDIKDSSLTGKDVKNSTLSGKDIKDRSLGGQDLLVRAAYDTVEGNALVGPSEGSGTPVAATSITAPARGLLMINASSDVQNISANDDPSCWLTLAGEEIPGTERSLELTTSGPARQQDCATQVTVPVAPGVHQVTLSAFTSSASTMFDEATLSVLFIPFGATGKVPAL